MVGYDSIAGSYDQPGRMNHPVRQAVYQKWLAACGEIRGLMAVDLGCGAGVSSRMLREAGATNVVGLDNSSAMLEIARKHEIGLESPIQYRLGDIFREVSLPAAELATAVLAVHYASSREELDAFFANVSKCLVAGGRFIAVVLDPEQDMPFIKKGSTHRARCVEEREDGRVVEITLLEERGQTLCSFLNYQWKKETYETALIQHGFTAVEWAKSGLEQTALTILTARRR